MSQTRKQKIGKAKDFSAPLCTLFTMDLPDYLSLRSAHLNILLWVKLLRFLREELFSSTHGQLTTYATYNWPHL
jgi:hypothetical protein